MNIDSLNDAIDNALRHMRVWNTDFNDMKFYFSKHLGTASKAAQNIYLDNSPRDAGGNRVNFKNGALNELYYFHPQTNSFGKLSRLLDTAVKNSDSSPEETAIIDAYDMVFAHFSPIAVKLNELKKYVVKGRKPSDDPTKTPARTIDHTGTCPACGRNIKLESGAMVAHGYEISGGWRNGSCFGVGYPPIEVSDEGVKALLAFCEKRVASLTKSIDNLPNINTFMIEVREKSGNIKSVSVGPDDPRFHAALHREDQALKGNRAMVMFEIKACERKLSGWKMMPLPDGNREHMK